MMLIWIAIPLAAQPETQPFYGMSIESVQGNADQVVVTTTGAQYIVSRTAVELWRRIDPATNTINPRQVAVLQFDADIGGLSLGSQDRQTAQVHSNKIDFTFYSDSFFLLKANSSLSYRHRSLIEQALWNRPIPYYMGTGRDRMWTDGYGGSLHAWIEGNPVATDVQTNATAFQLNAGDTLGHMAFPPKPFDFESLYGQNAHPIPHFIYSAVNLEQIRDSMDYYRNLGVGVFVIWNSFYENYHWPTLQNVDLVAGGTMGYRYHDIYQALIQDFIAKAHARGIRVLAYLRAPILKEWYGPVWTYPAGHPLAGQYQPYPVTLQFMKWFLQQNHMDGWYLDNADAGTLLEDYTFIRQLRRDVDAVAQTHGFDAGVIYHHNTEDVWSGRVGCLNAIMINAYVDYILRGEWHATAWVDTPNDLYLRFQSSGYGLCQALGAHKRASRMKLAISEEEKNRIMAGLNGSERLCLSNRSVFLSSFKVAYDARRQQYLSGNFDPDVQWPLDPENAWYRTPQNVTLDWIDAHTARLGWKTNATANSEVTYSSNGHWWPSEYADAPDGVASNPAKVLDHTVTVTNLDPAKNYEFFLRSSNGQSDLAQTIWGIKISPNTPTITASGETGGAVIPAGSVKVAGNRSQTFTFQPNPGYQVQAVFVDGVPQGPLASYTFEQVSADHSILVRFVSSQYTISATAAGGGQISPAGALQVASGGSQSFVITPDAGFEIADVIVDGVSQGIVNSYGFDAVNADHTIRAVFVAQGHQITATAGKGGRLVPSGQILVDTGGSAAYDILSDAGYQIMDVKVDGVSLGPLTSYTFEGVSANHTITAQFALTTSHIINTVVSAGGAIEPAGPVEVAHGTEKTFTLLPEAGYILQYVKVDGVLIGSDPTYTFANVTIPHTIEAVFARTAHAISASAEAGGAIEPDGAVWIAQGAQQTFTFAPQPDYYLLDVQIDGVSYGALSHYTFHDVNADHTIKAWFGRITLDQDDALMPLIYNCTPQPAAIQVPRNSLIRLHLRDAESGIDPNSVAIRIQDQIVYTGGVDHYVSAGGHCRRHGSPAEYAFTFQPNGLFDFDQEIEVIVTATDRAGNGLTENNVYSFRTEMRGFGGGRLVQPNSALPKDYPATACDPLGTIWVVWQAGPEDGRTIHVSHLPDGAAEFSEPVTISTAPGDQCRPAIAVDQNNVIYVVWQDNRRGNWDVCLSRCEDGFTWSPATALVDTEQDIANQTCPRIAIDRNNTVYVVWQDDRNGNPDIFLAASSDGFLTRTETAITNHTAQQTQPAIAIDHDNRVYVVWTDNRHRWTDIYGAGSETGWANIPVVNTLSRQTEPALAVEPGGSALHIAWVENNQGYSDIFYAATQDGLPASPLFGTNLVDDSGGANQVSPAISVGRDASGDARVYICWQDARNMMLANQDWDVYFTEGGRQFGANILVTGEAGQYGQIHPAIASNGQDQPFLVWVQAETDQPGEIRYAGTTLLRTPPLAQKEILAASGGYVGAPPGDIQNPQDVCVEIPAGALWSDLTVSVLQVDNAADNNTTDGGNIMARYEFGPSCLEEFAQPVTITIAYSPSETEDETVYWVNLQTDDLSQSGISDIERLVLSDFLHALRFTTTHFTQYVIVNGQANTAEPPNGAEPAGTGGCSMANGSAQADPQTIFEYLLPYLVLLGILFAWKRREAGGRRPDRSG
ncbi:MAG: hypothetical protein JW810_14675 [Sedimentisphaerales bacterium]|nr:hypothetical protein [Sedimentisphaerales bacterium]